MKRRRKKIGFCITCMNRTYHLKHTLKKNIDDNYMPDDVEFTLLDYNSADDLEEWIQLNFSNYIDEGILVYYKICNPTFYLRSHSRNIVFRLCDADIVCNIDADNFLGKKFAKFIIDCFSKHQNKGVYYTSNFTKNIFGRVCVLKDDFIKIRGYNEAFVGYGYEDGDLFNRLRKIGLKHLQFYDPEFCHSIDHSNEERVSEEFYAKNISKVYLLYINPYTTKMLFFMKGGALEGGIIIDNIQLNYNTFDASCSYLDRYVDNRYRVTLEGDWLKGDWQETDPYSFIITINRQSRTLIKEGNLLIDKDDVYYELVNIQVQTELLRIVSEAKNYAESIYYCNIDEITNPEINKNGYGRGIVYKNFDYHNEIILK